MNDRPAGPKSVPVAARTVRYASGVEKYAWTHFGPTAAPEAAYNAKRRLDVNRRKALCCNGFDGVPGGTRTPDLLLRRQLLYPVELRAHEGK